MVITRTPFRISLFGGGTDYPQWYRTRRGSVISATINKYCYLHVRYLPPFFDYKYRVRYAREECVSDPNDIVHPSVRECIKYVNVPAGLEIQHNADVPAMSGLGSSASFTVGLLHALYAVQGRIVGKRWLANQAIEVDQNRIGECVGSQDQIAAAFGGFNQIVFGPGDHYDVVPLTLSPASVAELENHLMLWFTGFQRISSDIAADQLRNFGRRERELSRIGELADEAMELLQEPAFDVRAFGALLDEQWQLKQTLSDRVANFGIQEIYQAGRRAGALGGKLLGAGGGGFMLFLAPPEAHPSIVGALKPLLNVPFRFEGGGSRIIYYTPEEVY
jgi:D-glycero-alpha-D-manno-heptose-7-phosphate kinase